MRRSAEPELDDNDLEPSQAVEPEPVVPAAEPEPEPEPEPVQLPVAAGPFPLAEPGEYYEGLWCGLPNYKCPYCTYATLEGPSAVELHILAKIEQGNKHHLPALELK